MRFVHLALVILAIIHLVNTWTLYHFTIYLLIFDPEYSPLVASSVLFFIFVHYLCIFPHPDLYTCFVQRIKHTYPCTSFKFTAQSDVSFFFSFRAFICYIFKHLHSHTFIYSFIVSFTRQMSQQIFDQYKKDIIEWSDDFDRKAQARFPIAQKAQEAGVRPVFILAGVLTFALVFALWKCGQNATSNLIGFVYPAFASFQALRTDGKDDDSQWLTYHLVYSFFVVIESVTDVFISWIPLYYFFKCAFLVWLMHPSTRGAQLLFVNIIDPILEKLEAAVEAIFKDAESKGIDVNFDAKNLKNKFANAAQNVAENATVDQLFDAAKKAQ